MRDFFLTLLRLFLLTSDGGPEAKAGGDTGASGAPFSSVSGDEAAARLEFDGEVGERAASQVPLSEGSGGSWSSPLFFYLFLTSFWPFVAAAPHR